MNLADAIRKAMHTPDAFSMAPPEIVAGAESVQVRSVEPPAHIPSLYDHFGGYEAWGQDPSETVSAPAPPSVSGNVVRLELFLSGEQMAALMRAVMAGQHSVLTLREAAAYLRVAPAALERLARDGEVPAIQIEGRWRFPKSRLDEWLNQASDVNDSLEVEDHVA